MRTLFRSLRIALVFIALASAGTPGSAIASERSTLTELGLGVGAVAATFLWGSAKILYAGGGSVTGGLAWILTGGRNDVARAILQPAIRGDYVVTPEHLMGEEPISFVGRDPRTEPCPY